MRAFLVVAAVAALGGCASKPRSVNPEEIASWAEHKHYAMACAVDGYMSKEVAASVVRQANTNFARAGVGQSVQDFHTSKFKDKRLPRQECQKMEVLALTHDPAWANKKPEPSSTPIPDGKLGHTICNKFGNQVMCTDL